MTSAQAVTVETLAQVLAAFNRHKLDAILTFFAEDAVLEMPRGAEPWGTRFLGKAAVRAGLDSRSPAAIAADPAAEWGAVNVAAWYGQGNDASKSPRTRRSGPTPGCPPCPFAGG